MCLSLGDISGASLIWRVRFPFETKRLHVIFLLKQNSGCRQTTKEKEGTAFAGVKLTEVHRNLVR